MNLLKSLCTAFIAVGLLSACASSQTNVATPTTFPSISGATVVSPTKAVPTEILQTSELLLLETTNLFQYSLATLDGKTVLEGPADWSGFQSGADLSPDGKTIVYIDLPYKDGNQALFLLDVASGAAHALAAGTYVARSSPVWSPDGKRIAFSCQDRKGANLCIMTVDQPQEIQIVVTADQVGAKDLTDGVTKCHWSADGTSILFMSMKAGDALLNQKVVSRSYLWLFDSLTSQVTPVFAEGDMGLSNLRYSFLTPDKSKIFFTAAKDNSADSVFRYDLKTRQLQVVIPGDAAFSLGELIPSPDRQSFLLKKGPKDFSSANVAMIYNLEGVSLRQFNLAEQVYAWVTGK